MNRRFTMMSVLALLIAGCGSNGGNNGSGGNGNGGGSGTDGADMSAAAGSDMASVVAPDMQPAYGCHALEACVAACNGNQTCVGACVQSATPQALTLGQAVTRCIRRECFPVPDGGPAPCTKGGGTPSPQCTMCQADVIKPTGSCGGDTMYCGTCYSAYAACQADLP